MLKHASLLIPKIKGLQVNSLGFSIITHFLNISSYFTISPLFTKPHAFILIKLSSLGVYNTC